MTGDEKKLRELGAILNNNNSLKITQAIKVLRNEPPFTGAIALLISYFDTSSNNSVRQMIREFMNDLKNQSSCIEVIAEIKRNYKDETLQMLASSCWQSGLDYSSYCSDFADLFLSGDYMTALECFTVIESSVHNMTRESKNVIINKIKTGAPNIAGEKSALASELISVLR